MFPNSLVVKGAHQLEFKRESQHSNISCDKSKLYKIEFEIGLLNKIKQNKKEGYTLWILMKKYHTLPPRGNSSFDLFINK